MDIEKPQFLVQQDPRLSTKEAESLVDEFLKIFDIKLDSRSKRKEFIFKHKGTEKEEKIKYLELVNHVRKFGVCDFFQIEFDALDSVFGSTFGLATFNPEMKVTTEWAGYKKELMSPCRVIPSEIDLAADIEFYKTETCYESTNHDFEMVFRNYRGYLFSSIALVDCYINRHIILFKFIGKESPIFDKLKMSRNTEERVELFTNISCDFDFIELKKTKFWEDFKRLKNQRNEIIHSTNPYMGFEIKEIASNLNLSINGVGGLLKKLQSGQGRNTLGFIERVRTSPVIHFHHLSIKENGNYFDKRVFSKFKRY